MHIAVFHHGRKWARAKNHMDARHCPDCGATVHGNEAQHKHRTWHIELVELFESLSQRVGTDPGQSPPWTAAVDEGEDSHEEIG